MIESQLTPKNFGRLSQSMRVSRKVPKVVKVDEYIVFYDEVLGKGQFGTVVKA